MAVVTTNSRAQIQVSVNSGTTLSPKSKKINVTSWAIEPNIEAEQVYNVGVKLAACQTRDLLDTYLIKRFSLTEG